jgi:hypothetical protein
MRRTDLTKYSCTIRGNRLSGLSESLFEAATALAELMQSRIVIERMKMLINHICGTLLRGEMSGDAFEGILM